MIFDLTSDGRPSYPYGPGKKSSSRARRVSQTSSALGFPTQSNDLDTVAS